ncbi:MAG: PhoD-like phosphatase, partial [Armatimonadetes bacterium]|nr:PhoD-like phosphatase [Armatimonadota bacterium]
MKKHTPGPAPSRRTVLKGAVTGTAALALAPLGHAAEAQTVAITDDPRRFRSTWAANTTRVWIGPEYWANRLQDWRIHKGRLECVQASPTSPVRTVHLLTRRLSPGSADFTMTIRTGVAEAGPDGVAGDAATGFLVGAGSEETDFRAAALVHAVPGPGGGFLAGMDGGGRLFIRDFELPRETMPRAGQPRGKFPPAVVLRLVGAGSPDGGYALTLSAEDPAGRPITEPVTVKVDPGKVAGNIALVSHPGTGMNSARFWFDDWILAGPGVGMHPERAWGPVLSTLYTVQNRVLKLTAQLAPVDPGASPAAQLQVQRGSEWKTIASAPVVTPGFTAHFRVEKWDTNQDVPFRVVYSLPGTDGGQVPFHWDGTVRKDPREQDTIVVASLSCVQQVNGQIGPAAGTYRWADRVWFPHADMVPNVAKHNPDLFFFAGDQIYEGNPTRVVREPEDEAELDYLYKWFLWCWSFGNLVRHTPCICIPDDHDVFQGNIWGMGGHPSAPGDTAGLKGGYGMSASWLNMMQRTQTSHLPDPVDPSPAEQGIGVYFTALTLGGIGFAILEDRKFKSSPELVQAERTLDNHITEPGYDTRKADVPGAALLGDRQLKFLREFAGDWRGQEMKAALSQTIFANLQISSRGATTGKLDQDLDSGGWPQSGRKAALRELRRGFMVHLAGDQHLASTIHHGVDEW